MSQIRSKYIIQVVQGSRVDELAECGVDFECHVEEFAWYYTADQEPVFTLVKAVLKEFVLEASW